MPRARKHLVCVEETPFYHVYSRCVRRAFLCGTDKYSGKSYEHRRGWIEDRVRVLSSLFSIEVCAYAVMSNHYHLVVKLDPHTPVGWSDDDVLDRWTALHRGPILVQRYRAGDSLNDAELEAVHSIAAVFRGRLGSLSWFMKCLNEPIARKANAEDDCTGHFWEARFHSQPLCSDRALLAAMAYVDLNPVRAGVAKTPEESMYTSIRARLTGDRARSALARTIRRMQRCEELNHFNVPLRPLLRFPESSSVAVVDSLPILEHDYFRLVDTTGQQIVRGKRGRIDPAIESILDRLRLSPAEWISGSTAFRHFYRNGDLRLKASA